MGHLEDSPNYNVQKWSSKGCSGNGRRQRVATEETATMIDALGSVEPWHYDQKEGVHKVPGWHSSLEEISNIIIMYIIDFYKRKCKFMHGSLRHIRYQPPGPPVTMVSIGEVKVTLKVT